MSTRSGKRIHKSLHENIINGDANLEYKCERNTRSRRLKQSCDVLNISLPKSKKRNNYVSYPTDDENINAPEIKVNKQSRIPKRSTLKDSNIFVTDNKQANLIDLNEKSVRSTRRTKKDEHTDENVQLRVEPDQYALRKSKKSKKSNKKKPKESIDKENGVEMGLELKKKSSKKTKEETDKNVKNNRNQSNTSFESFHSATCSPENFEQKDDSNITATFVSPGKNNTKTKIDINENSKQHHNTSTLSSASKSNINNTSKVLDTTFDKTSLDLLATTATTSLNSTYDKSEDKSLTPQKVKNTALGKDLKLNSFENQGVTTKSNNTDNMKKSVDKQINKISSNKSLDTTFDKSFSLDNSNSELGSNSDKMLEQIKIVTSNCISPIITSDTTNGVLNMTFDKSDEDISSIDNTKNYSKSSKDNILNISPVLIESSMENSDLFEVSLDKEFFKSNSGKKLPETPLKRESTFTKDGPDPIIITKRMSNFRDITPSKRKVSLSSPGFTPFHSNSKGATQVKDRLNLTHSLEKPTRPSVTAEPTRHTRVMFCSPVDNPLTNTQRKSKIIKSSMKGSNKSFLFEEKSTANKLAGPRKRSYTASEAESVQAKRSRLADGLQESVDRLSRPRTSSTPAKLEPSTPLNGKAATPLKTKSEPKRSKLPNFAALHQRRFDKMESLDECQERKAKRAKQLLVPTGGLAVLERSSPRATSQEPSRTVTKQTPKRMERKKPQTPSKTTIVAQKPTYTRFGFKMNSKVNPFSITSKKTEDKPVEDQAGLLQRPGLPSLAGATRKEMAKQIVLREKTSTCLKEKREVKRYENRTIIKGVRTNRRFELQMKTRNING